MIKRIHRFNTQTEQNNYMGGDDYIEPHLSLCEDNEIVRYNNNYLTFEILGNGSISWVLSDASATACTIKYSINGGDWVEIISTTSDTEFSVSTGDIVRFKGDNSAYATSDSYYNHFESTCAFNAYGNIMSLIDSDNFYNLTALSSSYTFYGLFKECDTLLNAKNLLLPATTLSNYCYAFMFYESTIITAPKLPATTLTTECYRSMFNRCYYLVIPPKLPATTLAVSCYQNMFYYCSSLAFSPELPATTLKNYCYQGMFYECVSLTIPPELPATTLCPYCYFSMFYGCIGLTIAPVLPATTLKTYCYQGMFYNCCNLKYIKALFTTTPSAAYTKNWVYNVSSNGTFIKNSAATWDVTDVNGIPSNWTVTTASA